MEKTNKIKEIPVFRNKKSLVFHLIGQECSFCNKMAAFKYNYKVHDPEKEDKIISYQEYYLCEKHKNKLLHDNRCKEIVVGSPNKDESYEYPDNFTFNSYGELMFRTKSIVNQLRNLRVNPRWKRQGLTAKQINKIKDAQKAWSNLFLEIDLLLIKEELAEENKD